MRFAFIAIALLLGGCNNDEYVVVEVSSVPGGTDRLLVTPVLDGHRGAIEEFEAAVSGTTSFALRFNSGTTGRLNVEVEARKGACTVAWQANTLEVPNGRASLPVSLTAISPPDCSGTFMGGNGCNGHIKCQFSCNVTPACVEECNAKATARALDNYDKAVSCGQLFCINTAGDCRIASGKLVDAFGASSGACSACLGNVAAELFGLPCPDPSSPNCNPATCRPLYTTCLNDKP